MIDKAMHEVFDSLGSIRWRGFCGEWFDEYEKEHEPYNYYEYYYAEGELYLIRDVLRHTIYFVKARSPYEAFIKYSAMCDEVWGHPYKGRDFSYEDFEREYCCNCANDEGCDRVPIDKDGRILWDFRYPCRDFEEV